jgi:hypothetical protein
MSGIHLPLLSFGADPLDDPLNLEWDAIVRNERPTSPEIDPDDFDLLRRVHAQANRALPDPDFFTELEHRLAGMYGLPVLKPAMHPRVSRGLAETPPRSWERMRPALPQNRWLPLFSVLAVLVLLFAAGSVVLLRVAPGSRENPAIPAAVIPKPQLQTMVQFDFEPPMWDMPDATTWTHMDFSIIELAPGKSFDTTAYWYTSAQGPLLLMVLSGELTMKPKGSALFYPDVERQHPPEAISPGKAVEMTANSAIAYSISDTGSGTNPGSVPMVALIGLTGKEDLSLPVSYPADVRQRNFEYVDGMPPPSTKGASVSIQHLRLAPFDSYVFDPGENWRFLPALDGSNTDGLQFAKGAIDEISPGLKSRPIFSSSTLRYPPDGPNTLFNLGEEPVDIYFFVVDPYPAPATPTS